MGKDIMASCMKNMPPDDILVMPEIFFVGGTVTKDISSQDLIDYLHKQGNQNAYFTTDKKAAADLLLKTAKSGDRIVIMGARDNSLTDLCKQILERL